MRRTDIAGQYVCSAAAFQICNRIGSCFLNMYSVAVFYFVHGVHIKSVPCVCILKMYSVAVFDSVLRVHILYLYPVVAF